MSLKFSNGVFWSDPKCERNNNPIVLLSLQRLTQTQPLLLANSSRRRWTPAFAGVTGGIAANFNQLGSGKSDP